MTPNDAMLMLNLTHWMVVRDFAALGGPSITGDLHKHFDDAADDLADTAQRAADDREEAVFRVYQLDFAGERVTDVTAQALDRIEQWITARREPLPQWLRDMQAALAPVIVTHSAPRAAAAAR